MALIIFIIVVLVLLGLALYGVQLAPFPDAPPVKPWIMVLCVVLAILVIAGHSGVVRLS